MALNSRKQTHWRKTKWLTFVLLGLWFVVSFVLLFFSREMAFGFFGWPFSFWVASQGAPIVFCVIVAFYAYCMNCLDDECNAAEGPP